MADFSVMLPDVQPSSTYAAHRAQSLMEESGAQAGKAARLEGEAKAGVIKFLGTTAVDAVKGAAEAKETSAIQGTLDKLEGSGKTAVAAQAKLDDLQSPRFAQGVATQLGMLADQSAGLEEPTLVKDYMADISRYADAQRAGIMNKTEVLTRIAATVKQYSAALPGWAADFRKEAAKLTGIDAVDSYQVHQALTTQSAKEKMDLHLQEAQLQLDKQIAEHTGVGITQITPSLRAYWQQHQQLKVAAENADNKAKWVSMGQKDADQAHQQIVSMQLASEIGNVGVQFQKLTDLNANPDKVLDAKGFGLQMSAQLSIAQDRMVKFINSRTIPQEGKLPMSEQEAQTRIKGVTDIFQTYQEGLKHIEGRSMFAALIQKSKDDVQQLTNNFKLANPYMTQLNEYGVNSKLFEAWVGLGSREEFEKRFGKNLADAMTGVMSYPQLHAGVMSNVMAGNPVDFNQLGRLDPNTKTAAAADLFHSPREWSKDPAPTDQKKQAYSNTMGAATQNFNPSAPQDLKAVYGVLADPNTKSFVPKLTPQQRFNAFGPVVAKVEAAVPQVGAALKAEVASFNDVSKNPQAEFSTLSVERNNLTGAFEVKSTPKADAPTFVKGHGTVMAGDAEARVFETPNSRASRQRAQGLANQLNTMLETYTLAARTIAPDLNTKLGDVQQRAMEGMQGGKLVALEPGVGRVFGASQDVPRNTGGQSPTAPHPDAVLAGIEAGEKSGDTAISHKGAAGRYQIMPETAKQYGLQITPSLDERLDVEKAGPAMVKYVHDLHKQFNGDIEKVAAAYNAGPGNVRKAEAKAAEMGMPEAWKAFLPQPDVTGPYIQRFKEGMNGVRG